MSKKISIHVKDELSLNAIDKYCKYRSISRSSLISSILTSAYPLLSNLNSHYQISQQLERRLFMPDNENKAIESNEPRFSLSEYLADIWITHITHKDVLTDIPNHIHTRNVPNMGWEEKNRISNELREYVKFYQIKKAIFVYVGR